MSQIYIVFFIKPKKTIKNIAGTKFKSIYYYQPNYLYEKQSIKHHNTSAFYDNIM
jgi:hypothetical protein